MIAKLFTPVEIGGVTLPNRIVVSPMCQYSAVDGSAQPWHQVHYGMPSMSGAGLLCVEATHVGATILPFKPQPALKAAD
jgi:2,4-dienoyl-CoA reductase-like NADH-dependent reductase (Old Yellow Enzyme family)